MLHFTELVYTPPSRYPDLFPVLNALLSAGVFGLAYLWSLKRLVELSWAMGSLGKSSTPASRPVPSPMDASAHSGSNGSTSKVRDRVTSLSSSLRRRNPVSKQTFDGNNALSEQDGENIVDLSEPTIVG